jgi:hypothetical protein
MTLDIEIILTGWVISGSQEEKRKVIIATIVHRVMAFFMVLNFYS